MFLRGSYVKPLRDLEHKMKFGLELILSDVIIKSLKFYSNSSQEIQDWTKALKEGTGYILLILF